MYWISIVALLILCILLGLALLYAFYTIDRTRSDLEEQILAMQKKINRLIDAINAVNHNEYILDQDQEKKIDGLNKKVGL